MNLDFKLRPGADFKLRPVDLNEVEETEALK